MVLIFLRASRVVLWPQSCVDYPLTCVVKQLIVASTVQIVLLSELELLSVQDWVHLADHLLHFLDEHTEGLLVTSIKAFNDILIPYFDEGFQNVNAIDNLWESCKNDASFRLLKVTHHA